MNRFAAKAHVFVTDLDAPVLDSGDQHHLERVLRLRAGDEVTLCDGRGGWRIGRFGSVVEPIGDAVHEPALSPALTVGFALVKGERPELVVQKLTELGIDRIVPFAAARSVVQWSGDKAARAHARLAAVAREAAMQSRRAWLPVVELVTGFADLVEDGVALCERDGPPPTLATPTVLIGPEGGWAPEELAVGLPSVGLGPTVLRAETAAIAASALLTGLRARIVVAKRNRHAQ